MSFVEYIPQLVFVLSTMISMCMKTYLSILVLHTLPCVGARLYLNYAYCR